MTFRHTIASRLVFPRSYSFLTGASRVGTVQASLSDLIAVLGEPTVPKSMDGKVTKVWVFDTPRGPAALRDYWWNAPNEWSIGAVDHRAARWLRRYIEALLSGEAVSCQ